MSFAQNRVVRASALLLFTGIIGIAAIQSHLAWAARPASGNFPMPAFAACDPTSEYLLDFSVSPVNHQDTYNVDPGFCSAWNPEFRNNGFRCCAKYIVTRRKKLNRCAPERRGGVFCEEMTDEQKLYTELVKNGADALTILDSQLGASGQQAYCGVNNGFLANGRRVVPTVVNRLQLRTPGRCVDFGTDRMTGMIEWVGRQVSKQYADEKGVHLIVGDVSAPRGGCLSGRGGRRGHASHTTGQDADIGYLTVKPGRASPVQFHRDFDAKTNWWLIKQFAHNPYACIKVIFLDRKNIRKLEKAARGDEEWKTLWRFIRHIPGHKNHMHVRVGDIAGPPGCTPNAHPELEEGDDVSEGAEASDGDQDSESADPAEAAESKDARVIKTGGADNGSADPTPAPVDPAVPTTDKKL